MNLSIHFNQFNSGDAQVSLGSPNTKDEDYEFRIGVVVFVKNDKKVRWAQPEWVVGKEMKEITFVVKKENKVVVEKRKINSQKIDTRTFWNASKEWPAEAEGSKSVSTPWCF